MTRTFSVSLSTSIEPSVENSSTYWSQFFLVDLIWLKFDSEGNEHQSHLTSVALREKRHIFEHEALEKAEKDWR